MDNWYCSDHHLWHHNILGYCNRPFKDIKEMNEMLLTYHNQYVKPSDHVSFLGDLTMMRGGSTQKRMFKEEIAKYNGHKRLYLGNHDHWSVDFYRECGFEKIYATWRTEEGLLCSHIPIHPRSLGSAIANVHGHIHDAPEYESVTVGDRIVPYINVSVEAIEYRPINKDEVLARIKGIQNG
jgi:calcineurin-like phosphoesterase family protein